MKQVDVHSLNLNPFNMIGRDWMLIGAGNQEGSNAMTASWGHLGSLWGHGDGLPTAICYIRPQRYTKVFVDKHELFSLSFFDPKYRKALSYMGFRSGRDENKIANAGLTPVYVDDVVCFEEAKLTFICRKLYVGRIQAENFLDHEIEKDCYPKKDFSYVYIGEIKKALIPD